MVNYFSAENLSKSFGEQFLFENLTFGLARGDKTALIARNGAGKTTLLKILMGKIGADSGKFTFRRGIKTAFLEQEPELDGSRTIDQVIMSTNTPIVEIIRDHEKALENHSLRQSAETLKRLEVASSEMDHNNAWDYERRLKQLLNLFGIVDTSQLVSNLSGGEKKRLALAMILLDEPEFIVLDEPTNHLDIDMIEWLEKYLSQSSVTLLMVTHDRYFLDRVCNRIIELSNGKMFNYNGNYELFLQRRNEREEVFKVETDKAGQLMKKELEWLRRMPKARTGKSKSRIDAFDKIKEKATRETDQGELTLKVRTPRLGGKILDLEKISKAYGNVKIVDNFTYKFSNGERVGVIGRNGSGKTAFLNVISRSEPPDSGIIDQGETVVMGYFRQMGREWKQDQRVIEAVKEIAEIVLMNDGKTISASQFLEHFMFPPESQYKMISKLSGGELRRLSLLTVLIKNPNFLILDEPTNDLDLFALNKLEEFLLAYKGCLIIVSHDRYFLDKLTDHLFVFEGGGKICDHYGTYSAYRSEREIQEENIKPDQVKNPSKQPQHLTAESPAKKKAKLTFREQQEYNRLEPEIEMLEAEKLVLEEEMNQGNLSYQELELKSKRVSEVIALIDAKLQRWLELGQSVE